MAKGAGGVGLIDAALEFRQEGLGMEAPGRRLPVGHDMVGIIFVAFGTGLVGIAAGVIVSMASQTVFGMILGIGESGGLLCQELLGVGTDVVGNLCPTILPPILPIITNLLRDDPLERPALGLSPDNGTHEVRRIGKVGKIGVALLAGLIATPSQEVIAVAVLTFVAIGEIDGKQTMPRGVPVGHDLMGEAWVTLKAFLVAGGKDREVGPMTGLALAEIGLGGGAVVGGIGPIRHVGVDLCMATRRLAGRPLCHAWGGVCEIGSVAVFRRTGGRGIFTDIGAMLRGWRAPTSKMGKTHMALIT